MTEARHLITQRLRWALLCFAHLTLYFLSFTMVITGLQFLLGITLVQNEYVILIALVLSTLTVNFTVKLNDPSALMVRTSAIVAFVLFLMATTWLTGKIYDKSWDGMAYHQIGIRHMAEGWNPAYEQIPDDPMTSKYYERSINLSVWVNHYSKGLEQFSAAMMGVTGNIESGKVFNLLLIVAAFCSTLYLLFKLAFFHWFWNAVIALVAAMNPVAVNQIFSYYLDGAIASSLLILITQFILLYIEEDRKNQFTTFMAIGCVSIILINLKFTGLIYHAWIGVVFIGLLLYQRRFQLSKQLVLAMSVSVVLAIVVAGFNPYITNIIHKGHPFYPIAGDSKIDAIVHMVPPPLKNHNSAERFLVSTFSRCDNLSEGSASTLHYKIPFTVSSHELKVLQSEGVRLGGFGVLWSGIFLLSLLGAFVAIVSKKFEYRKYLMVILLAVVGSVAINPVSWWARFVPQLWLFPVIVLIVLLIHQNNLLIRNVVKSVFALMLVNTLIVAVVYLYSVYANTTNANRVFDKLKTRTTPVYVYTDIFSPNVMKLKYHNIPYVQVKSIADLPCGKPTAVLKMDLCVEEEPVVCTTVKTTSF